MELSNQLFLASSKLLDGQFGVIKQVIIFRLKDRSQFGLKIEKKKIENVHYQYIFVQESSSWQLWCLQSSWGMREEGGSIPLKIVTSLGQESLMKVTFSQFHFILLALLISRLRHVVAFFVVSIGQNKLVSTRINGLRTRDYEKEQNTTILVDAEHGSTASDAAGTVHSEGKWNVENGRDQSFDVWNA